MMEEGFSFPTRDVPKQDEGRRWTGLRNFALTALGAFLLGGVAVFAIFNEDGLGLGDIFSVRSDDTAAADATPAIGAADLGITVEQPSQEVVQEARDAVERVEQVEVQTGGIDQRVAAMEQRLTRLDLQSQAAAGNAARAEGLLISFAARRAIERGQPLGFLEDQLQLRFGDARPNAVQTVIDAAANPATQEQLLARLDGLAPQLLNAPEDQGMAGRVWHELSQLFIIRNDETPSPVAELQLQRARSNLETGRIEFAVTEVRNMPNAAAAADWLLDAERYAAAQRALEVLETAAILEPRELRDGSGTRVEQPSPAN